jgi:gramicidin S synthase 2
MKTRTFPLSDSQLGLYYEWQKDKSFTQYNIAFLYEFPGLVDPVRLKTSFEKVVSAHPGMKVRLKMAGVEVVQYIDAKDTPRVLFKKVREQEMKRIIHGFIRPVNLMGSPLYRIEIYQTEKKLYALFAIHHIIFDGYSTEIFHSDLSRAYAGEELAEEAFTGCDHAATEQIQKESEAYREAESWFGKKLNGIGMTKVPMVSNRKSETGYRQIAIERISRQAVNDFCTRAGISPNNLFAGALGICLNRYTREETISFCTAYHGRIDKRLQHSTGMFVKTLPVILKIESAQPVGEYLAGIRTDMKELWSQQIYPFSEMVKKSGISMDVSYTFQKGFPENLELEGLPVEIQLLRTVKTHETLSVYIYQKSGEYEIRCEYNDSLYDHEYIRGFTAAIKNLAMNMIDDRQRKIGALPLLDSGQETVVKMVSVGKTRDHDRTRSLADLFREQVAAHPDRIAVVFDDNKLTYRELDRITDRIAKKLLSLGVKREETIGIMIDRSDYMVIYPLGVLKAGCAYMPLDYTMPSDRLEFMVKDAGAVFILSEGSRVAEHLPSFKGTVIRTEEIPTFPDLPEIILPKPAPEDLFVLLYTSGSTGTPKGCMLEHRNIVNFVQWYIGEMKITPGDRSIAYANFAFDAHMIDIYPMITSGAAVYILPSDMRLDIIRINQYMEDNGITVAFLTTQIGRQFAEDIENKSLRVLSVGGERLIPTKKPPYTFYNLYGPTEITICSTFYNIERDYNSSVIGRSVDNVSNYILDQNLHMLPAGVAGELCIGGEGVTRGYMNRDELTREKFIHWNGLRLYRSGDLARYNESGEIEYISRLDNQVKLRGLRIELGEIENVMSGYNGITSTVVDVKEIGGVQHLIGYYTSRNDIDPAVLKDFLRESLTEFMIPTALIRMDKFPMTSNGKVNRKLLPVPSIAAEEIVAPASPMEQDLFAIVAELLKTDDFGATTNLFSLGLTSILPSNFPSSSRNGWEPLSKPRRS